MTGAQYIVDSLIKRQVTDAFGIPGGVILPLLYAMDERKDKLMPHLSYHEQCAGFAACGYAQASGKLGVAYATRGPGFTNLITAIADAYYDSLPVLFITAHTTLCPPEGMRIMADQEMDTCSMVSNITKKAVRLDDAETFANDFYHLCELALASRKGPVFVDVSTRILSQELPNIQVYQENQEIEDDKIEVSFIIEAIRKAKRPVILAGDGINQGDARDSFRTFVQKVHIPVISSRFAHDILSNSQLYYGYVGSHGMRCANFILSKTDLILSLGNRLHFPPSSESFRDIFNHARIIRCDIDKYEFSREIPNTTNVSQDVALLLDALNAESVDYGNHREWVGTCDILRRELSSVDHNGVIDEITSILKLLPSHYIITNDVGNNEFWVSRACVDSSITNRVLYSKSFGALGCGLGKAIGAYYATNQPVVCFVGDQGLQMNIQELQFISQQRLPVLIVLMNNSSSGMIKDREAALYGRYIHTTADSGFLSPSYKGIADAYGMDYMLQTNKLSTLEIKKPMIMEIRVDEEISLVPNLPRGKKCQDMQPEINKMLYDNLDRL